MFLYGVVACHEISTICVKFIIHVNTTFRSHNTALKLFIERKSANWKQ